jgi:hypothetical protein
MSGVDNKNQLKNQRLTTATTWATAFMPIRGGAVLRRRWIRT